MGTNSNTQFPRKDLNSSVPDPENDLENEYKPGSTQNVDFRKTKAYLLIKEFLFKIDLSLKTEKQAEPEEADPLLGQIERIVDETELSTEPGRYANVAMRDVIRQICRITDDKHIRQSFGNLIRMDFGTGHELNYLCYLYKRFKNGQIKINEVVSVLKKYFRVARKYIKKFNVEAAGARGCWSLDDYMLLPYLFGSSENFEREERVEDLRSGLFREAWEQREPSRMLDSMIRLGWKSMNVGLLRMYDEEVLGKRVVTQHFIYCNELPI